MEAEKFDVFIIGSGTAGQHVALECAKAGKKVAIADKREFGGTCANRGCDPKKVLVGFTEVIHSASNLSAYGISGVPEVNWKAVQKFKNKFTAKIPKATEKKLQKAGIKLYHQSPKFLDKNTLSVEGKTVKSEKIIIATGLRPRTLDIKGSKHLKTSDDFLSLKKLPKSMVFIGAGYVGMEFAHIAARCGVQVTLFERGAQPLNAFDGDLVNKLTEASKELGIKFEFNAKIENIEKLRKNCSIQYSTKGKNHKIKARMVFNTSGRVPAIDTLELEKGGVEFSEEGIAVNEYLQSTTNKSVYACGDVSASDGLPLTPLSSIESALVAQNVLKGNRRKLNLPVIPSVVFTLPQLASVGLDEAAAKKKGCDFELQHADVPSWYSAKRVASKFYSYKILVDKKSNTILGAHLLSDEAGETINLLSMAIQQKVKVDDFKKIIFTYPTWASDLKSMV